MTDKGKAVVLLSGGMDSCVCTAIAREQYGADNLAFSTPATASARKNASGKPLRKSRTISECNTAWL